MMEFVPLDSLGTTLKALRLAARESFLGGDDEVEIKSEMLPSLPAATAAVLFEAESKAEVLQILSSPYYPHTTDDAVTHEVEELEKCHSGSDEVADEVSHESVSDEEGISEDDELAEEEEEDSDDDERISEPFVDSMASLMAFDGTIRSYHNDADALEELMRKETELLEGEIAEAMEWMPEAMVEDIRALLDATAVDISSFRRDDKMHSHSNVALSKASELMAISESMPYNGNTGHLKESGKTVFSNKHKVTIVRELEGKAARKSTSVSSGTNPGPIDGTERVMKSRPWAPT